MKKLILLLLAVSFLAGFFYVQAGSPPSYTIAISDTAYDATSWDGVTDIPASKNAIRDKIETLQGLLTNEAGLYAALSDVSLFLEDLVDDTTPSLGGDLDCNGNSILYSAAQTGTVTLTGFHSGNQTQNGNITSTDGNNMLVRQVRAYISTDPTSDENINFRLSFYNADEYTEDQLIKDFYFNLTYTETNGGVTATDTTDTVDDGSGLVIYDLIRFHAGGGTAENQRLTAAPTATGLTFTAAGYDHTDNAGIVRVHEITDSFFLVDADASNEIHIKLQALSAATASMSVVVEVDLQ